MPASLLKVLPYATLATAFLGGCCSASQPPVVQLNNGSLAGHYDSSYNQDLFLGVPYASPPTGELRLARPTPPNAWNGTRPADSYGPWCMGNSLGLAGFSQNITANMSEDCLHVNIVRPATTCKSSKLPVLVWIHGGGWDEGSANEGRYNGSFLVQNSVEMGMPIIFASFNYRLGVFGMLAGSAMEEAGLTNLVLHDQRQALRWIQENIEEFGGDASRVTVMGESAGAISIGYHLITYGGRDDGLFSAAIAESGSPYALSPAYRNATEREAEFEVVLNATGCADAQDSLSCLRSVSAKSLNSASPLIQRTFTIDGDIITDSAVELLEQGRFIRVPLLIGTNRNEGTSFEQQFTSGAMNTEEEFIAFASNFWTASTASSEALQTWADLYQKEIDTPSDAGLGTVSSNPGPEFGAEYGKLSLWMGDVMFGAGRRFTSRLWAENSIPTYSYFFDTVTNIVNSTTLGAAHFQEIPYVFGNTLGVGWETDPFPSDPVLRERHIHLAQIMSKMWISFAVTHSPNHHQISDFNVTWPEYTIDSPQNIVFNATKPLYLQSDTWRKEAIDLMFQLAANGTNS